MGDLAYVLFLVGAAIIGGAIFLYSKKKSIKFAIPAALVGVILIGIATPSIMEEIEAEEKAEQAAAEAKQKEKEAAKKAKEEAEKNAPIDEKIKKVVYDTLGKKSNTDRDRVHKIEVYGEVANVWLNASENLSNNMTKKGMWIDTFKGLEELAKFEELERIAFVWMFPLVDKYGNESDGKIMSIDFTREIIDKINFDNVDFNNAPTIAEDYWEHNALK